MKPGTSELPSEDSLVLHLLLSRSEEQQEEALREQQEEVQQLQRLLEEQQEALVHQQRHILEQQRRMYQQMEQVKVQYNMMMESIKLISSQNLHMETMTQQFRTDQSQQFGTDQSQQFGTDQSQQFGTDQSQQALSLHKVDMEVERSVLACSNCGSEEYCRVSSGRPRCETCTACPAGFSLLSPCSVHADTICQDRDECLEINELCGNQHKCLNTPGGFRCEGMTARDADSGLCGHAHFYDAHAGECRACYECDGDLVASPCTSTADTVCSGADIAPTPLSLAWSGHVSLPGDRARLHARGGDDISGVLSTEDGRLLFRQHGLVWLDENVSVRHTRPSFVQVSLHLNATEVAPGDAVSLSLRGAGNQTVDAVQLHDGSVSVLWLSHDTGAVAMTARATVSAHHHTNHRPVFRTTSTSDPYVAALTHDGRGVRFSESGAVRFVFQQAVYAAGPACVDEGFQVLAYRNRNGTTAELARTFKPGVHYRDTSLSLTGAAEVDRGDTLGFEILTPSRCDVRFFGDEVSGLSLVWVPRARSASLTADVSESGVSPGAVRNRTLVFRRASGAGGPVRLPVKGPAHQGSHFVFREPGAANVGLDLKLIHSCDLLTVRLMRRGGADGRRLGVLAQQVGGRTPEGSRWASVALRASFQVRNGTSVFFALDCERGRVNQISHETGSRASIIWVAA